MSMTDRREFLRGTAWMGAAALASGCVFGRRRGGSDGSMMAFRVPALAHVRVGVVGLGHRGTPAVHRLSSIPGVTVAALCDLHVERVLREQRWLAENRRPAVREYSGAEGYKALCESELDLVYVTTPWALHAPVALYAMEHGKHVAIEVPAAMSLDECWALVATAERTRRHCMQLENCCYGEAEMLCLNLARKGLLGEIVHAEGAYIHDLRRNNYADPAKNGYQGYWRLKWNAAHVGNPYPTHGLLPLMQAMKINRGDRFETLVSMQADPRCNDIYATARFGAGSWQAKVHPACGDMSTTVIRSTLGKTVLVQHDVNTPRPYSRLNLVEGTRGLFCGTRFDRSPEDAFCDGNGVRFCWEDETGAGAHGFFDFKRTEELRREHCHPLWRVAGPRARKGGHGGMDFLMDLRLAYCLQNGLPLDMDVYDLATSCSLCELTEASCRAGGAPQEVPDFTAGAWRTARPLGIESVDLDKIPFDEVREDKAALNV